MKISVAYSANCHIRGERLTAKNVRGSEDAHLPFICGESLHRDRRRFCKRREPFRENDIGQYLLQRNTCDVRPCPHLQSSASHEGYDVLKPLDRRLGVRLMPMRLVVQRSRRKVEHTKSVVDSLTFMSLQQNRNTSHLLPLVDGSPYFWVGHFGDPVDLQPANLRPDGHQEAVFARNIPEAETGPAITL